MIRVNAEKRDIGETTQFDERGLRDKRRDLGRVFLVPLPIVERGVNNGQTVAIRRDKLNDLVRRCAEGRRPA